MTKDKDTPALVLDDPGNLRVYAKAQRKPLKDMMNAAADRIERDTSTITELKHVLVLALLMDDNINKIKVYARAALKNAEKR